MNYTKTLGAVFLGSSLAVASMAGAAAEFEGPQADIDAVMLVLEEWGEARDAGEIDAVVALHHPDVIIMTRNRAVLNGHPGVRTFYKENYAKDSSRHQFGSLAEIRVFGDAAILSGLFLVTDEAKGIEDPGYFLLVLRKDAGGAWRIYRDIDTPSPDGLQLKPQMQPET